MQSSNFGMGAATMNEVISVNVSHFLVSKNVVEITVLFPPPFTCSLSPRIGNTDPT